MNAQLRPTFDMQAWKHEYVTGVGHFYTSHMRGEWNGNVHTVGMCIRDSDIEESGSTDNIAELMEIHLDLARAALLDKLGYESK